MPIRLLAVTSSRSSANQRTGYSLIELMVVLSIIILLSLTGLPSLVGGNDRFSLDNSANQIRQMLIDARIRSLAPSKNDALGTVQVYQVAVSDFPAGSHVAGKAVGSASTNLVTLQQGLGRCGTSTLPSGFTNLKALKLPRDIYIANFYPFGSNTTDTTGIVRFSVGRLGFTCGSTNNTTIESTDFTGNTAWLGTNGTARYLTIELASRKIGDKRYLSVDRLTSDIRVHRTDPQASFSPTIDSAAPRWINIGAGTVQLLVTCDPSGGNSTVHIQFKRAQDYVASTADPNRLVFYDLSWNFDHGSAPGYAPIDAGWRILTQRYYWPVGPIGSTYDTVDFAFQTDAITTSNKPARVTLRMVASDEGGTTQPIATSFNGNGVSGSDATKSLQVQVTNPASSCTGPGGTQVIFVPGGNNAVDGVGGNTEGESNGPLIN